MCHLQAWGDRTGQRYSDADPGRNDPLVVKKVPAEVCSTCGEEYVDQDTTARLLQVAEEAVKAGVQVEVREYRGG